MAKFNGKFVFSKKMNLPFFVTFFAIFDGGIQLNKAYLCGEEEGNTNDKEEKWNNQNQAMGILAAVSGAGTGTGLCIPEHFFKYG